jgi:hypothetical protein
MSERRPFTLDEMTKIRGWIHHRVTYQEMAIKLDRPVVEVQIAVREMKRVERAIIERQKRRKPKRIIINEEMMWDVYSAGYSPFEVSQRLGYPYKQTAKAIAKMVEIRGEPYDLRFAERTKKPKMWSEAESGVLERLFLELCHKLSRPPVQVMAKLKAKYEWRIDDLLTKESKWKTQVRQAREKAEDL